MSKEPELYATARVTMTIEYDHPSSWSTSIKAEDLFKSAGSEARRAIEHIFAHHNAKGSDGRVRVLGTPDVTVVTGKCK